MRFLQARTGGVLEGEAFQFAHLDAEAGGAGLQVILLLSPNRILSACWRSLFVHGRGGNQLYGTLVSGPLYPVKFTPA